MQHKIVLFGKGGIGKSTTTSNLAVVYAQMGLKVLVIGCDPKHDTTIYLTGGRQIPTVLENAAFLQGKPQAGSLLVKGTLGIDCVEAGGPEPGIGCAGRGITRMSEILKEAGVADDTSYDVILYDVLGDVVCGGFAAPLRQGFADKVVIVTSEELMSLYAANNIAKAVRNYSSNGISLVGLIANLRDPGCDEAAVSRFAAAIGTKVLQFLPRDPIVRQAEYQKKTVVETAPEAGLVAKIRELAQKLLDARAHPPCIPQPMTDEQFNERSRKGFPAEERPRGGLASVAVVAAESPEGACCGEESAASAPSAAEAAPSEPTSIFVSRSTTPIDAPAEPDRRWRQFLFDAAAEAPEDPAARAALESAWERRRLELRGRSPKSEPGAVNLIGFPDDAASREWTALLERSGLRVNARLLPGWVDADKLRSAGIQVFFPNPKFQSLYRSMADALPGRSALLSAPCGLDYSRRWLLHVAALAGLQDGAERAWEEGRLEIQGRWEELRGRASRERLAFVGDLDQLRGLAGPGGAGGVPLIPVLKEMGFALDFIVYAGGSTRISEKKSAAKNRLCWFSSEDELARLLEEGDFKAVYSEFPGDERVTKRGKTPFGPEFFEVGPQGAVRSLDRLLGACGWNFYLRYADYL